MKTDFIKISHRTGLTSLFLFVLMFPSKYYLTYHIVIVLAIVAFLVTVADRKIPFNNSSKVIALLIAFLFLSSLIRFFFYFDNFRDFVEIFRLVPIFLLSLLVRYYSSSELKPSITAAILIFTIFNFAVSLCQFLFKSDFFLAGLISFLYNSEVHTEVSLQVSNRALGLTLGPGPNGVISAFCFVVGLFSSEVKNLTRYLILSLSALTVVLSQSQTAFVALICIIAFSLTLKFITDRIRGVLIGICIVAGLAFIGSTSLTTSELEQGDSLFYLSTLEQGVERSSFQVRLEKQEYLIGLANKTPFFIAIGWGKSYFGEKSSAMDNEHLYIILVYGIIVWITLFLTLLISSIRQLKSYFITRRSSKLVVPMISLLWVITALPSAFFLYPPTLLTCFVIVNAYSE